MSPTISIVVPLFNESDSFPFLVERLDKIIQNSPVPIEVVLVDDGSTDNTAMMMELLAMQNAHYQSVFLARNYGHQTALTAGLQYARGTEAIMIIDGDLQDPPELLFKFYDYYKQGYDVVYAIRKKRREGFMKKLSYKAFYRILKQISYIDIPIDSGDFSLISRRVANILNRMPEESRYIRGMRTWVGFKQIGVEYDRSERMAGSSKYSLKKLFQLAYNGIFNFSEFPIKFISKLGYFTVIISLIYLGYTIFKKVVSGNVPEGFTATLMAIILFSGVQLISLGVIGEYLLRIFFQVKGRPLFVVKNVIQEKELVNE
jgi:dolichol-phosphate mannosyltransferase